MSIGLYVHIPFCIRKCSYCDFVSLPLPPADRVDEYVKALKGELSLWAKKIGKNDVASIYVGGGTPTLLPPKYFWEITFAIRDYFSVKENIEFTVEANPGTLSFSILEHLVNLGVNRLSLGVQAMDDALLEAMGRFHRVSEVKEAFSMAREAGISNIGADLIYGLPGQDISRWEETLLRIVDLEPEHISAYGLTLADGTPWGEDFKKGNLILPDQDTLGEMYRICGDILPACGYVQYEISNFARPGFECRHNKRYWRMQPYLGVGLGAASYINNCRFVNIKDFNEYIETLKRGKLPVGGQERPTKRQAMAEFMFLGLRTVEGISVREFYKNFGVSINGVYGDVIDFFKKHGFLKIEGDTVKLDPKAYPVANEIFLKFII